jgi:hypothetical protein
MYIEASELQLDDPATARRFPPPHPNHSRTIFHAMPGFCFLYSRSNFEACSRTGRLQRNIRLASCHRCVTMNEVAIGTSNLRGVQRIPTSLHRIGTSIDSVGDNQTSDHEWPHWFPYSVMLVVGPGTRRQNDAHNLDGYLFGRRAIVKLVDCILRNVVGLLSAL